MRVLWSKGYRPGNASTLVETAAKYGNVSAVEFLIEQINALVAGKWLPVAKLMAATPQRDETQVRSLLEDGTSPDERSVETDGRTPLLVASAYGYDDIVKLLLETKAVNVEVFDLEDSLTPLLVAASQEHVEVVRLPLMNGANIDAEGRERQTVSELAEACTREPDKSIMLELLRRSGEGVEALMSIGRDPKNEARPKFGLLALLGWKGEKETAEIFQEQNHL
jgi:hypothetical protein